MKQMVIIDTDPGIDDAMALAMVLKSSLFEVLAITTVCGNSTIKNTTRNARYILDFFNKGAIPIYSGAAQPLERPLEVARVHGANGLEGIDLKNAPLLTEDAADQILKLVKKYPDLITIVTLGPMTNIATAIQKDPDVMQRVKRIVSMGGAIEVAGNKNQVAEFNFYVDPEAADIVISSDISKIIIPLDACNGVWMSPDNFTKIKNERLRNFMVSIAVPYAKNLEEEMQNEIAVMYDPLTIFYLISPEDFEMVDYNIQIETKGSITRGMSVADRRLNVEASKNNATVAMWANRQRFIEMFLSLMNNK